MTQIGEGKYKYRHKQYRFFAQNLLDSAILFDKQEPVVNSSIRKCIDCNSCETYMREGRYARWYKVGSYFRCHKCYARKSWRENHVRRCVTCSSETTALSNGIQQWHRTGPYMFNCNKCYLKQYNKEYWRNKHPIVIRRSNK